MQFLAFLLLSGRTSALVPSLFAQHHVNSQLSISRRESACSPGTHNTTEGLIFTKSCGKSLTCSDTSICQSMQNVDSIEDCMELCASANSKCFAVTYTSSTQNCTLQYNSSTVVVSSTTTDSAIADVSQLTPSWSTYCPSSNGSTINNDQAGFVLHCQEAVGNFGNYCPTNMPCRRHAYSFDECLGFCTTATPLCTAAVWTADMTDGYLNCNFKNASSYTGQWYSVDQAVHAGELLNLAFEQSKLLPTNETSYTSQGQTFDITSGTTRSGVTVFGASHETSIDPCIDLCASSRACAAVSYATELTDGWDNCQLFNSTGAAGASAANITIALLRSTDSNGTATSTGSVGVTSATDTATSDASTSSGSNKGRDIGLGIGLGLVLPAVLAIIAYCIIWPWYKKRHDARNRPRYSSGAALNGGPGNMYSGETLQNRAPVFQHSNDQAAPSSVASAIVAHDGTAPPRPPETRYVASDVMMPHSPR